MFFYAEINTQKNNFRLLAGLLERFPPTHRCFSFANVKHWHHYYQQRFGVIISKFSTVNVLQHLLVLLFGTFRIIAANSKAHGTNMTSQALGVRYT